MGYCDEIKILCFICGKSNIYQYDEDVPQFTVRVMQEDKTVCPKVAHVCQKCQSTFKKDLPFRIVQAMSGKRTIKLISEKEWHKGWQEYYAVKNGRNTPKGESSFQRAARFIATEDTMKGGIVEGLLSFVIGKATGAIFEETFHLDSDKDNGPNLIRLGVVRLQDILPEHRSKCIESNT
jgi:hypothetical protein